MLSDCLARIHDNWTHRGAIRLEEKEPVPNQHEALPLYGSLALVDETGINPEEKGSYTQSRLLLECVIASIWNGSCLSYLLLFPHVDSRTNELLRPRPGFVYMLLALTMLPLIIGMRAGAEALHGDMPHERLLRAERLSAAKFGIALGFLACCAGIWAIVAYVVCEQAVWLQLDLALTTLCVQALLIRNVYKDSGKTAEAETLDFYAFLEESSDLKANLPQLDCLVPFDVKC